MKTVCHIVALSKITRRHKYNLCWKSVFWTIRDLLTNDLTCEKRPRIQGDLMWQKQDLEAGRKAEGPVAKEGDLRTVRSGEGNWGLRILGNSHAKEELIKS
jgi:hypothetical protein